MTELGQVIEILRRRGLEYADAARDAPCPNSKLINLAKAEAVYESICELCDELVPWPVIVREQDLRPLPYISARVLSYSCRTLRAGAKCCMLNSDFHGQLRIFCSHGLRRHPTAKGSDGVYLHAFHKLMYGGK